MSGSPAVVEFDQTVSQAEDAAGPLRAEAAVQIFAHVVSVEGGHAIAAFDVRQVLGQCADDRVSIGSVVGVKTPLTTVVGVVTSLSVPTSSLDGSDQVLRLMELDLVGEILADRITGERRFHRGVSTLPALGDPVGFAQHQELTEVYSSRGRPSVTVGTLYQDAQVNAHLAIDDLLSKHFAVVGSTGSGKSCCVAGLLHAVIDKYPASRIVILDIHNEYSAAFKGRSELVNTSNLQLPFWLLSFDELASVFVNSEAAQAEDVEVLLDAVTFARRKSAESVLARPAGGLRRATDNIAVNVDSPTTFRLADIVSHLDDQMGRLERTRSVISLRRIKARIEALTTDPRYAFMFGSLTVQDRLTEIIGRLFRVPTAGKPVTILDLSAVPPEIMNVVISVVCRLAFDLGVWSKGGLPVTLICEEAHRYAPNDKSQGFEPTRQALGRIAKEGRKYGISLGVVTQRPAELDATLLSQCSTIFAHRLSNESDQQAVRARSVDCAARLLDFLSSLGDREAIVVGQAASMPMRVRFAELSPDQLPAGSGAVFSKMWGIETATLQDLERVISRWRNNRRFDEVPVV